MSDEHVPTTPPARPTRRIDANSLKGLAHPLRMRIFELLSLDGPATSARLAERLGENTGTVSWHLRQLAAHGFIEEDAGRGTKRERWWRRTGPANELNLADFRDDPASAGAVDVYLDSLLRLYFERVHTYVNEDWDEAWRAAGTVSDWRDLRLTRDQLAALNTELAAVVARHTPAPGEADPEALPVVVQLQSFPRRRVDDADAPQADQAPA
ncbi:winged helix-turn-helix domain-containing protein [Yinghuangia seranimata]|uniref:winged helix-turn-helix domain-containing protein n=1 Tax=Yinghuangia seranimata TaxID=408067 RepID=UPI00248CA7DC|nr:winged helix-turn-helix domain-containing protein [Yinghuangia seranimata]MDI2131585.1 winged helix-turn-helix domain-containing protein [Yinghuangia seranimata]